MDKIAIGAILSPFGKDGWCKVKSFSGETEHFVKLKEIEAHFQQKHITLTIEAVRTAHNKLFLKFAGIDDIDAAKKLGNMEIVVERKYAQQLEKNEYYFQDLIGCTIYYDNADIGEVISFFENGAQCLLEVHTNDDRTVLIPFIKEFIGKVDIEKKRIELLEGFLLS